MAARNSGIPAPVREEVTRISGKAAGCLASAALTSSNALRELGCLDLVGPGEDDLIADR